MAEDKSWKDYVFEQPIDDKRTYKYEKDYNHDVSYENERKHNNVHSPSHYMHCLLYTSPSPRDRG